MFDLARVIIGLTRIHLTCRWRGVVVSAAFVQPYATTASAYPTTAQHNTTPTSHHQVGIHIVVVDRERERERESARASLERAHAVILTLPPFVAGDGGASAVHGNERATCEPAVHAFGNRIPATAVHPAHHPPCATALRRSTRPAAVRSTCEAIRPSICARCCGNSRRPAANTCLQVMGLLTPPTHTHARARINTYFLSACTCVCMS